MTDLGLIHYCLFLLSNWPALSQLSRKEEYKRVGKTVATIDKMCHHPYPFVWHIHLGAIKKYDNVLAENCIFATCSLFCAQISVSQEAIHTDQYTNFLIEHN